MKMPGVQQIQEFIAIHCLRPKELFDKLVNFDETFGCFIYKI